MTRSAPPDPDALWGPELDAFAGPVLAAAGAAGRLPAGGPRRLRRWLRQALERTEDELFARRFAAACPVPGAPAHAFLHRLLPAPQGGRLLAGIRFKGGDVAWPFVELLAWERPWADHRVGRAVLATVFDAFASFGPRAVRLRWPGEDPPPLPRERLEIDQLLLSAPLADLRRRDRPWGEVAVDVRPAGDLSWVPDLHRAHGRWQRWAGPRGAEVQVASEAELAGCLEDGAVVCAWAGEGLRGPRWAGVAAARREDERLVGGYCVVELFLAEPLRGQRRAAVLQRALVDALVDRGRDHLWGTVHRTNTPSRRTARRVGRAVQETWWFVAPEPA